MSLLCRRFSAPDKTNQGAPLKVTWPPPSCPKEINDLVCRASRESFFSLGPHCILTHIARPNTKGTWHLKHGNSYGWCIRPYWFSLIFLPWMMSASDFFQCSFPISANYFIFLCKKVGNNRSPSESRATWAIRTSFFSIFNTPYLICFSQFSFPHTWHSFTSII